MNKPSRCSVCDQPSDLTCKSCMKVCYCSRDHQKSHWKSHKPDCFPAVIATNDKVGRHLLATRDIQQGEVIFKEKPVISGPLGHPEGLRICLACFKAVTNGYSCSSCSWPVCDLKCEKAKNSHATLECEIFSKRRIQFLPVETSCYEKIIVLRGVLLKYRDPDLWDRVCELQTHSEVRKERPESAQMLERCVTFVRETCGLSHIQEADVDQVLGAVVVNAFVSDDSASSSAESYRNGSYLFYFASMPAHDCTPNTAWVIQKNSEFLTRASVPIKAGESITQLYSQPTAGTQERMQHLRKSKFFECTCNRCLDPTELGTYFSSIKCPGCGQGYLLLEDPGKEPARWKCESCSKIHGQGTVDEVIEKVQGDLQILHQSDPEESRNSYAKSVGVIEKLLKSHSKTLHPNHYILHTLENELLQRMSFILASSYLQKENERVCMAERMVVLARKCIQIADTIWPGYNRHRGRLLYFLQQGLLIPLKRTAAGKRVKKLSEGRLSELRSVFEEVLRTRSLVHTILSIEPEGREENFIARMMEDNSGEMQDLFKFFKI